MLLAWESLGMLLRTYDASEASMKILARMRKSLQEVVIVA
jgi:hypothetical protein